MLFKALYHFELERSIAVLLPGRGRSEAPGLGFPEEIVACCSKTTAIRDMDIRDFVLGGKWKPPVVDPGPAYYWKVLGQVESLTTRRSKKGKARQALSVHCHSLPAPAEIFSLAALLDLNPFDAPFSGASRNTVVSRVPPPDEAGLLGLRLPHSAREREPKSWPPQLRVLQREFIARIHNIGSCHSHAIEFCSHATHIIHTTLRPPAMESSQSLATACTCRRPGAHPSSCRTPLTCLPRPRAGYGFCDPCVSWDSPVVRRSRAALNLTLL